MLVWANDRRGRQEHPWSSNAVATLRRNKTVDSASDLGWARRLLRRKPGQGRFRGAWDTTSTTPSCAQDPNQGAEGSSVVLLHGNWEQAQLAAGLASPKGAGHLQPCTKPLQHLPPRGPGPANPAEAPSTMYRKQVPLLGKCHHLDMQSSSSTIPACMHVLYAIILAGNPDTDRRGFPPRYPVIYDYPWKSWIWIYHCCSGWPQVSRLLGGSSKK